ncbi:hypothetical protein JCM3775_006454 [Rhodotorula graminis]|uniref:PWWP domain-containing protein n=1 Tax=Rhodotorula graminis (strain WP1) TaxID=578459 RepID=A0A0P9GWI0_RHOGW|nr:uncharacterized protein RHOBADRAFT_67036 [Rhodotorula graminis WP1]KPV71788.1 hypothetical protein RHOBADRAFT_67036 [Rhodotorula graminis WP1]
MPSKPSKKAAAAASDLNYQYSVGDIVLGKVKGFPSWPGQIVDVADAPVKVQKEKPPKAKNTHLVQFFPTGDFSYLQPRDLVILTPREIESYISSGNKKKGDLLTAYKTAQDPAAWRTERADQLAEWEALQQQNMLAGEEDQLASDGEGKKDKKRKRATPANGAAAKKNSKAAKKDDAAPAAKKAKTTNANTDDPAEMVKTWRHKLQKAFLGKGDLSADEMHKCAEYFDAMESLDMKKEWLVESKLAKVLKRIALLKDGQIPNEDKYSFRERSSALANKWNTILGGSNESPAPASGPKDDAAAAAPASKGDDAAEPKAEDAAAGTAKADEPAPAAVEDKKDEQAAPAGDVAMEDAAPAANGDAKKEDAPAEAVKQDAAPAEASAETTA